jgi:outer membrane cobalamin receptor
VGQKLIRRPPSAVTFSAARAFGDAGEVRVVAARVGARDDRDFAAFPTSSLVLPTYDKVDLSAVIPAPRRFASGVALVIRWDNVFGAKYEEVAHFPAPRATVFVGVRVGR